MSMAVYFDEWSSRDAVARDYGADTPAEHEIIYAGYTYEDYSGDALVVFARDGKLWENNVGHCSCNGLDEWSPEETTAEALKMRKHWPGLADAVDAYLTRAVTSAK
jgi:hypothetical protein